MGEADAVGVVCCLAGDRPIPEDGSGRSTDGYVLLDCGWAGVDDIAAGGSFNNPQVLKKVIAMGYQLITAGSDVNFLAGTSRKQRSDLQTVLDRASGSGEKEVDSPY